MALESRVIQEEWVVVWSIPETDEWEAQDIIGIRQTEERARAVANEVRPEYPEGTTVRVGRRITIQIDDF